MKKIYLTIIALIATLAVSAQVGTVQREFVDLGLPSGTLWATCNVGALKPEEVGTFFAWGETQAKNKYEVDNYRWMYKGAQPSESFYNKYTYPDGQTSTYWYKGKTFIGDGKTILDPEDDAATANWGRGWCMPTYEQIQELTHPFYTTCECTTLNGVKGYKITSKSNGKSIFLPANRSLSPDEEKPYGFYWSRSLNTENSTQAWYMFFNEGSIGAWYEGIRYEGFSVRPVRTVETVDLGLPSGTLWANYNVGANYPEDYGDFYAWGETEPNKEVYGWNTYKWCNGTYEALTKYNSSLAIGVVDDKTELEPEDDAATVNWGSSWCMPSLDQIRELCNPEYTTYEWVTQHGVNGHLITSKKNGNTIFLPAAGLGFMSGFEGSEGAYWSSSLKYLGETSAYFFEVTPETFRVMEGGRFNGHSVRPVLKRSSVATSINSMAANKKATESRKFISGGNIVIEKGGKQYNVNGTKTK